MNSPIHSLSALSASQDVFKRLNSVRLLALNLGVPKRTIDSWKEEMESNLIRLSMGGMRSDEHWKRVEESLEKMQACLAADRTILDENGNLSESWRTSSFFSETRTKGDSTVARPDAPRRSRSETINEGWINVPRSPVGSPMIGSPANAKSEGAGGANSRCLSLIL